jgi:YfiH family protein
MAWIYHDTYCINSFLYDLNIPHCVSTKNMGNMRNIDNYKKFINSLKSDKNFENCNLALQNIFLGKQTHSYNYFQIKKSMTFQNPISNNDGFYSQINNVGMGIYTADCMPIFIIIPNKNTSALLHCGWKGIVSNIVEKFLLEIGLNSRDEIFVVIGPHLKGCCYEVGKEFKKNFDLDEKFINGEKKYFLNMQKNLAKNLINLGITKKNIKLSNFCTGCNNDIFFSYRFDKQKNNRMLSFLYIADGLYNNL